MKKLIAIFLVCSNFLYADLDSYYPYKVDSSASNYGSTGIFELPNARFMQEGSLRLTFSGSFPNEHTTLTASPFSWMEASYRYTEVKNRKYGPASYSGNQTRKDKGFDVKFGLLKESYYLPNIALGLNDIAGTGLFSSEYIVASKRVNNFDLSLGLGWGLLGSIGGIKNPLYDINDSFRFRDALAGQGGSFSYNSWFSGQTSLIGGLEYDLKKYGLRIKLEYDTTEPDENFGLAEVDSNFNIGLSYHYSRNLTLSTSLERGNQFRVSFSILGSFLEDSIRKPGPKNVVRLSQAQIQKTLEDKSLFYRSLNRSLRDETIYIQAASYDDNEIDVAVASPKFFSMTRTAGRTARVVSALASSSVDRINVHTMNGDLQVATFSVNRKEFDEVNNFKSSEAELLLKSKISSSSNNPLYENADFIPTVSFPEFNWSMSPSLKHQIGGPEGFYLGQLFWKTDTSLKFRRNLLLYTSFGINLYDTFDDLRNPSRSTIPHVRSDIQDYLTEGKNNIQRMQLEYFSSPLNDVFVKLDVGLLEEMFGGYGGEVLYRPFNKKTAIGLAIHRVRQRDYDQRFNFRDYQTTTGHLSIYSDLPMEINSQISIGKYLAGDKGATLDLSRRFKSGFTLGIFATKTNLSAVEFGEGSFDKGFYFSIPTKLFYSDFRTGTISFGLHPLTKDGGAILNQHNALFSILGDTNFNSVKRDWDYFLK